MADLSESEAPSSPAPQAASDATVLLGWFALALAGALLAHQLWWNGLEVLSWHFVVVLAALWTAARPTSVGRLLIMLAAEVVSVGRDMPAVFSHTLLLLVCGAAVLAYSAARVARTRRLPSPGELFVRIAPFLRVQLLLVYLAAGLSKLNTSFLDPETSCAVAMSARIAWWDPSLLQGIVPAVPVVWCTVLIELSLPVLLALRRTRPVGLAVGAAFHVALALAGNVPFSALALAYYVTFLPADAPSRVRELLEARRWVRPARRVAGSRAVLPLAVTAWLAAAALSHRDRAFAAGLIADGTRVLLLVGVLGAAIVLLRACRPRGLVAPTPGFLRPGQPIFAAGIAALALNAASPYLGFKTESAFTMFSNLQTEAGEWNHVLIPESVRVLRYQDELVRVVASNDPRLARRGRDGRQLVRYELERYLRLRPGTTATVTDRAGRRWAAGPAAPPSLGTRALDEVAKFRDVRPLGRRGC